MVIRIVKLVTSCATHRRNVRNARRAGVRRGSATRSGRHICVIGLGGEDCGFCIDTAIGLRQQSGEWLLVKSGQPIEATARYHVLVNNFMYAGGDGFGLLAEYDPAGYDTGIHWRQPVIDWIIAQESSPTQPLEIGD